MRILVTNHWLKKLGGSETFTYTLIGELVRRGYDVDYFTFVHGAVSDRITSDFGVSQSALDSSYDIILANHHTTVDHVHRLGRVVQTCHGISPKLEKISPNADIKVAISREIADHIGTENVIWNGIDCNRFYPKKEIHDTPKRLLSLVHSEEANRLISSSCMKLGIEFRSINKYRKQVWSIEDEINHCDLVVSLGRGAYEAMSCGRPVIVYDHRPYQDSLADGYINSDNIHESIKNNLSGRRFKKKMTVKDMVAEIQKYNREDGTYLRNFALDNLNITRQVDKYIELLGK